MLSSAKFTYHRVIYYSTTWPFKIWTTPETPHQPIPGTDVERPKYSQWEPRDSPDKSHKTSTELSLFWIPRVENLHSHSAHQKMPFEQGSENNLKGPHLPVDAKSLSNMVECHTNILSSGNWGNSLESRKLSTILKSLMIDDSRNQIFWPLWNGGFLSCWLSSRASR